MGIRIRLPGIALVAVGFIGILFLVFYRQEWSWVQMGVLAVVIVPLVLRLVYLVWKRRFRQHARLARWTYPIWLYVSLTGLTVYLLLYQVYGYR